MILFTRQSSLNVLAQIANTYSLFVVGMIEPTLFQPRIFLDNVREKRIQRGDIVEQSKP